MISPAVFIPMAEELGLIREIGRWVLVETCRQNRSWQDAGLRPIKTSVNLSARQLNHPAFAETVRAILAETKLEPQHLQLELTETALMGGSDATPASLKRLFEMGVVMAIDDFGTGYSSLDYLRRLPFDVLKIDTSFVADIPADSRAAALAQSIVSMAHSLQLEVVGEGVETLAQLEFLRGIGCDQVQGYLASRPRPVHEMTALLDHDTRLLELAGAEIANHSARALSDATSLRHTPSVH
jgi:EAL domain-containing protein (putative c-di-GMP-specific phosphodiesterase class I)